MEAAMMIDDMADEFDNLNDRVAILIRTLSSFRRDYTKLLRTTMPNNWLRRHGLPARRKMHARWIEDEYAYNHCSICGFEWDEPERVEPSCPQCEAKMKRKEVRDGRR